jgi:hypothetical protein
LPERRRGKMSEDPGGFAKDALGLHIAEYEVLMTRNTYWTTIQFSVAPAIAIYLTLLITTWESIKIVNPTANIGVYQKHLLWLALLGTELFILAGYNCVYEIYNNVRYVETRLRPEVDKLIGSQLYWKYEQFLEGQRGVPFLIIECWATVAIVIAECVISIKEIPWGGTDFMWFAATLAAAILVAAQNVNVTTIRMRHFR